MNDETTRRERVRRLVKLVPLILVGGTVFVLLFSWVVMKLWNWLMPELFGLTAIDQWQALGILVLSKILFGGFHGGSDRRRHGRCQSRRFESMSPEEQERLRSGLANSAERSQPATHTPG